MASRTKAVIDAIVAALQVNYAGETVYPPDQVWPVLFLPDSSKLDPTVTTIYFVRLREDAGEAGPEACTFTDITEAFVLAATRYQNPSLGVVAEGERVTIACDLAADVKQKLEENQQLSGSAIDAFHRGATTDYELFIASWVVVEVRLGVKHRHEKGERT